MAAITPAQAQAYLDSIDRQIARVVIDAFNQGLLVSLRRSVTAYMQGGGSKAPPNPPPGPLRIRSGRLRRGVRVVPAQQVAKDVFKGGLGVNLGEVPYARIHELGGKTSAHEIVPRNKKALRFFVGGQAVFSKRVHHPGSLIPARPFLRPAVRDTIPDIRARIDAALSRLAR